jgi:hypothetical protein
MTILFGHVTAFILLELHPLGEEQLVSLI